MEPIGTLVETAAILAAGLAVRLGVALALLAALLVLLLPILYAGEGLRRLRLRLEGFAQVAGLWWRAGTYYAPSHAWLRVRAGLLRIGLDDLAGRVLRRVTAVTLPAVGTYVKEGDALLTIGRGRGEVVIPSPVEGTVARVNARLAARPDWIVTSPYGRGWIVDVRPAGERFTTLRRDRDAAIWMTGEAARLARARERAAGIAAADGGEPVGPAHLALDEARREGMIREFLQVRQVRRVR